jgi:hypothetical protein
VISRLEAALVEMCKPRAQSSQSVAAEAAKTGLGIMMRETAGEEAPARNIAQTYLDTGVFLSNLSML